MTTDDAPAPTSGEGLRVADNPEAGRYEARIGPTVAGFSEYRSLPGRLAFTHTVVDRSFASSGVGSRLARGLLEDVRARGLKVTPYCEFIAGYIERHPEYADLVTWGRRGGPEAR